MARFGEQAVCVSRVLVGDMPHSVFVASFGVKAVFAGTRM